MFQVQEVMDDLEKKIMGNVEKDFERKGEVSKPKKKQMMFAQEEMVGQSSGDDLKGLEASPDGVEEF